MTTLRCLPVFRAVGIPRETRDRLRESQRVYHAWNEVYDGETWQRYDVTRGRDGRPQGTGISLSVTKSGMCSSLEAVAWSQLPQTLREANGRDTEKT